jgi:hypothetical protein
MRWAGRAQGWGWALGVGLGPTSAAAGLPAVRAGPGAGCRRCLSQHGRHRRCWRSPTRRHRRCGHGEQPPRNDGQLEAAGAHEGRAASASAADRGVRSDRRRCSRGARVRPGPGVEPPADVVARVSWGQHGARGACAGASLVPSPRSPSPPAQVLVAPGPSHGGQRRRRRHDGGSGGRGGSG